MALSDRQQEILKNTVLEYIRVAQPVSSQLLEERSRLNISPATIRSELQVLCEEGFLSQPHISSGRVPTDRGYRFFVDSIYAEELKEEQELEVKMQDSLVRAMIQELARASSHLVMAHIPSERFFFKEGWEGLFKEPEFQERDSIANFARFVRDLEGHIQDLKIERHVDVYIGKENPFSRIQDFSIIFSQLQLQDTETGFVALIGPKRMQYKKNINLLKSLHEML